MVAIFTGQGSGLQKGSGAVLGAAGLLGNAGLGRSGGGVFVNAANGNLVVSQRDAVLVGRGTDIDAGRSYNRRIDTNERGGIASNWRFNQKRIDTTLALDATGSTLKLIDVDGAATTYTWDGSGYVSSDGAGAYDRFVRTTDGFVRTDGDTQVQEKYFARYLTFGLLTQAVDTSGNATDYTYTTFGQVARITTADGGYVEYGYSGTDPKVRSVKLAYTDLATGTAKTQTIVYTYTGDNLATATIDLSPEDGSTADGKVYTQSYGYAADGALTSITETDGSRLDIGYDGQGRVTSLTETGSGNTTRTTTLSYASGATTITDAAGQATTLRYNSDGTLASITAPPATAGGTAQTTSFTYTARGDVEQVTDPVGNVTRFTYDDRGNVLTATDRLGNVVRRTWTARNQLRTETRNRADTTSATAEHTDRYVYDSAARLRFTISATGQVTERRYNGFGQTVRTLTYTADRYDTSGLSSSATPSESEMASWVAALPDQTAVQQTDYSYDARGDLVQETSYAAFAAQGSPSAAEGVTRVDYLYDQAGRLVRRSRPGRTSESFVYDGLGRLIASSDTNEAHTSIVFDDAATRTIVRLENGLVQTSTYDKTGALVSFVEAGAAMPTATTTYQYDPLGRARVVTDPNGLKRYTLYDKVGRTVADVSQAGELTEYRYDANDRVIATIRYATLLSAEAMQSVANPASPVEMTAIRPAAKAGDQWTWMTYDAEDRLVQTIDGSGAVVANAYDASGQLISTTETARRLSATQVQALRTNPPTAPIQVGSNTFDRVTRIFYDAAGLVVGRLDGEGYLTTMAYDAAGQKVAETAYSNPTRTAERAGGTLETLLASFSRSSNDRTTNWVYDAQGLLRFVVDPLNHVTEYSYFRESRVLVPAEGEKPGDSTTAFGRVTTVYAGTIAAQQAYTTASVRSALQAASLVGAAANRKSYDVEDQEGRVAYAIAADGAVTNYAYDIMGQVVRTTRFATKRPTATMPDAAEMREWAAGNASGLDDRTTTNGYDEAGRLILAIDAGGYRTRYDYDAGGRLIAMVRFGLEFTAGNGNGTAGGGTYVTTTYAYDVLDRLIGMTAPNGVTHSYTYAANGLMEFDIVAAGTAEECRTRFEYDGAGRVVATYRAWGRPEQTVTRTAYTAFGEASSQTDELGRVTSFGYLAGHVDVGALDPALHQQPRAVLARHALVERRALGEAVEAAVERLDRRAVARYDQGDAADLALLARGIGRRHRTIRSDGDLARSRRHRQSGAQRQPRARRR